MEERHRQESLRQLERTTSSYSRSPRPQTCRTKRPTETVATPTRRPSSGNTGVFLRLSPFYTASVAGRQATSLFTRRLLLVLILSRVFMHTPSLRHPQGPVTSPPTKESSLRNSLETTVHHPTHLRTNSCPVFIDSSLCVLPSCRTTYWVYA